LRIGWIDYLNTLPFNFEKTGVKPPFSYRLVKGVPSRINRLISEGKVDAGFISSAHYIENFESLYVLPHLSVSSLNRVRSVIILSDKPLEKVRTVYLTDASKTSRYLTQVIFSRFLDRQVDYRDFRQGEELKDKEAVLLIGDNAIKHAGAKRFTYDLSSIWYRETGLPFVFALWSVREDFYRNEREKVKALHQVLKSSKERFFSQIERYGLEESQKGYLKNLDYSLTEKHLESLKLFSRYLKEMGLVKETPVFRFTG